MRMSSRRITVLLASLAVATLTMVARDGRDFAGFYSLNNVTRQSDLVQLTLHLQVYNYSGADVTQAIVTLRQSGTGLAVYGSFAPIKRLVSQRDARLNQAFTIPLHEYERWQKGINPNLFITYQDNKGSQWERSIEVTRRPPPFPF